MIKFKDNPDFQVWTTLQNIKNGQLKNPYHKSVYGIGYYGVGNYSSRINNLKTEEYIKWFSMFNRCYDKTYQERQCTYIGCEVGSEFHNFQNFANWFNKNKYGCKYPLELDKDLLYEGNKIYSPSKCCLIPKEINTVINQHRHNPNIMSQLYTKYKNEIPFYLSRELCKLTKQ